jgi:hypothetical protein
MIIYKHLRHEGKLYATRCQIQEGEFDPIGIGFAICSDKDNFCRKIGRELAFKRANIALISKRNSLPIRRNNENTNKTIFYAGFSPKFKSIYWSMEAREQECMERVQEYRERVQEDDSITKEERNCTDYVQIGNFRPFNEKYFTHIFEGNKTEHSEPVITFTKKEYITPTITLEEKAPKEKEGKLDWSCLPLTELQEVVKVFEFGKGKYGKAFTYRQSNGVPKEDLFAAIMRHLESIQSGEEVAEDSKCLHIAHIIANGLMYIATLGKTK